MADPLFTMLHRALRVTALHCDSDDHDRNINLIQKNQIFNLEFCIKDSTGWNCFHTLALIGLMLLHKRYSRASSSPSLPFYTHG